MVRRDETSGSGGEQDDTGAVTKANLKVLWIAAAILGGILLLFLIWLSIHYSDRYTELARKIGGRLRGVFQRKKKVQADVEAPIEMVNPDGTRHVHYNGQYGARD
jgi:hypothetical protein